MARTRPRHLGLLVTAAAVAVAFAVAVFVGASFSSSSSVHGLALGKPAPAWSGVSLGGARLSSRAERGRWVVLDFFATWCDGCKRETPQLKRFATDHRQVAVVSVLYDDSAADARAYAASHGISWPILATSTGSTASAYQAQRGLPETFVIGPSGRLVRSFAGAPSLVSLDRAIGATGSS